MIGKVDEKEIFVLISRIFDPIGFLAPALVRSKLLLQEIWNSKNYWDSEANDDVKKKSLSWFKDLRYLNDIKVSMISKISN